MIYKKNKRHSYHRTDHKIHCHVQNFLSQLSRSLSFYVLPFYFNTFYKLGTNNTNKNNKGSTDVIVLLFAAPQKKTDNELFFNLFIANF